MYFTKVTNYKGKLPQIALKGLKLTQISHLRNRLLE